jgi:hypothetical protein
MPSAWFHFVQALARFFSRNLTSPSMISTERTPCRRLFIVEAGELTSSLAC